MPSGPWTKNRGYDRNFQTETTIQNVEKGVGEKEEKKNERKEGRERKEVGGGGVWRVLMTPEHKLRNRAGISLVACGAQLSEKYQVSCRLKSDRGQACNRWKPRRSDKPDSTSTSPPAAARTPLIRSVERRLSFSVSPSSTQQRRTFQKVI